MLMSITENFTLWSSSIVLNIFGIKIKANQDTFFYNLLYPFRGSESFGKNNKIISVDKNGNKKEVSLRKYKNIKIYFHGDNNTVIIHEPCKLVRSDIVFFNSNSQVEIGANCIGKLRILNFYDNCNTKIGRNCYFCSVSIMLNGNQAEIGNDCLFSNNIRLLCDGHSVIDKNTNEVLNKAKRPIKIGNHVWIGERVTMTKNAQIPDNCVVGIASVVTKSFEESNCVIAGTPAGIVKRDITWDLKAPV